ncbi:unnamed protein product [Rotaria magnacalcarata]
MPSVTIHKFNASQRVSTTYNTSSQHRTSTQHQTSSNRQLPSILQPSSQTNNYFGPVRASTHHNQSQPLGGSNSQNRAAPYSINSPQMNRRPVMSRDEIDVESVHSQNENAHSVHHISIQQNQLDLIAERCDTLEHGLRSLQSKTDKLLKIALASFKNEQFGYHNTLNK